MFEIFKLDKKSWKRMDYWILTCIIIIVMIGILSIYSVVGEYNAKKQFLWLLISLVAVFVIVNVDYKIIGNYAGFFYWCTVVLLVITRYAGTIVNGAKGWIILGPVSLQPAELAKIALILILAKKLDDMDGNINNLKNFGILFLYCFIPMILIVIQPDMGMTLVCFFIVLGIFYSAGLNRKVIITGLITLVLLVVVVWFSDLMQPHWKARLVSFLEPDKYKMDLGYQVDQAKIAIGSGKLLGTGFLKGTQIAYVPEIHTDCIISAVGEQWGFVGNIILLFLYGVVIYRTIKIASSSRDIMGSVMCIGTVSYLLFSIIQHIGMNIGIMPVTGITLPFVSYGGSSLLTNFVAIALVLNVSMHKEHFTF